MVQPLVLWVSNALGPNAYNMELALRLLNVPFELKRLSIPTGEHKSEMFKKIHPDQRVPALVDPNFTDSAGKPLNIWESGSVLFHILENYDRKGLFYKKDDPVLRAQAHNWVHWTGSAIIALSYQIIYKKYVYMDEKLNPAITKNQEELRNYWLMVEEMLNGKSDGVKREFLVGTSAGMAEIVLFGWFGACGMLGVDTEEFPAVKAWVARTYKALDIEKHIGESLATTAEMIKMLPDQ